MSPNGININGKYADIETLIRVTEERAKQEERVAVMQVEIRDALANLEHSIAELIKAVKDVSASVQTIAGYLGALNSAENDRLTRLLERAADAANRAVNIVAGDTQDIVGGHKSGK